MSSLASSPHPYHTARYELKRASFPLIRYTVSGLLGRGASLPRDVLATKQTVANQAESSAIPSTSGLDFIDLVGLDDSTVWHCHQDAVTYGVLVGQCPAKESSRHAAGARTFNIKQVSESIL